MGALSEAAASPRLGAARGQGCSHLSKHKNQLGEDGNAGKSCHSWGSTNVHGILGILTLQQFKPIPGTFVGMPQGFWQNRSPRPFQLPHLVEPVRKSPTPAYSSEDGTWVSRPTAPHHLWGSGGAPQPPRHPEAPAGDSASGSGVVGFLGISSSKASALFMEGMPTAKNSDPTCFGRGHGGGWARQLHKPTLSSCFTPGVVGKAAGPQEKPLRGERPSRQWALAAWSLRSGVEKQGTTLTVT